MRPHAAALLALCAAAARGQGGDLPTLHDRLLASYVIAENVTGADADVALFEALLTPAGTFRDLNYTADPKAAYAPWTHMLRAAEMGSV